MTVRLALNLGYSGAGDHTANLALAREADRLGYAVVWAAEAYGFDAPTVLAWIAARTNHIDIGSAVMQIPARSPAMTAMTAATLDALSGGRFRLGLGVSGPQVSEGWHGVRFADPLGRTREYIEIVRMALRRERVSFDGHHYRLPLPGGPGKALALTAHPVRAHIPIYLASLGPKNLELTGEIADGWLALFLSPDHARESLRHVRAGRQRIGRDLTDFDVVATMPLVIGPDWRECADLVRPYAALYIGGMGTREKNFYFDLAVRMGFEQAAIEVRDRYLAGDRGAAMAAIPEAFLDATALLGPKARIRDRMSSLAQVGVTTVSLMPIRSDHGIAELRTAADALAESGVAD